MAKLSEPHRWNSKVMGVVESDPRIYLLKSSKGAKYYWLPYWITVKGKRRYGQFSQIVDEPLFVNLLKESISKGLFSRSNLRKLRKAIDRHLGE